MSVTAVTSGSSLEIMAAGDKGAWAQAATLVMPTETNLSLTTPTNLETLANANVEWGTATSTNPGESQGDTATTALDFGENLTKPTGSTAYLLADGANYVVRQDLIVKVAASGEAGKNLKVQKVVFTVGTNSIAASGRLLVVASDGSYQLFKVVDGTVSSAETGSDAALVGTMEAGTEYTLNCYFYFDGTDDSAYTNNATDLSAITAAITLSID